MDKCPECGYQEMPVHRKITHVMNVYVYPETGKVDGTYNNDAPEIVIQPKGAPKQTKLIRQDLYVPKVAPQQKQQTPAARTPSVPIATSVAKPIPTSVGQEAPKVPVEIVAETETKATT